MFRSLYICYFGVREPLVQTQVLPYLRELVKGGYEISLLTFEPLRNKNDRAEFEELAKSLAAEGITWEWLPYHKRLSAIATAWDIFRGAIYIWRRIRNFDILHGRVHTPTLMGALARKFSAKKPRLLFDIRGFMPEEYTDAGIWPENGLLYRTAKRIESWLMKEADGFVVLTKKAREILFPEIISDVTEGGTDKRGRPVEVIPCCVDLERFAVATSENRELMRAELGIQDRYVGVYVGSFGGWYLTEETADFFGALKSRYQNAYAMILTQSDPEVIRPLMQKAGYSNDDMMITRVPSADLPRYLCAADLAVSFIKPCYSKEASSPTKNAEYLASGLPLIANAGIGDVDQLIEEGSVGALVSSFDHPSFFRSLEKVQLLSDISSRARIKASNEFEMSKTGGVRYIAIYRRILH